VSEDLDPQLEDRLRAHFADRAAREPVPGGDRPAPTLRPDDTRPWYRRPTLLAAAAALLVVAGLAAGLALGADDDPEGLDVVGPDSTETTAPSTSTSVPTTSTSTTTTAPPNPSSDVRALVVAVEGVLGWWDGSRFVRWDEGQLVPAEGGETYRLVGLDGTSTAVGSPPEPGCGIGDPVPLTIDVGLEYPDDRLAPVPVAVAGVVEPAPRPVVAIGAQPAYVEAVSVALEELGVDDPSPELVQVLRTDFEGDGVDEVLLVVERLSDPNTLFAQAGDYSVVLLRQVVDEQVVTTVVASSIANPGPNETPFVNAYRVGAVADLNGDGTMELVTRGVYYEGSGTMAARILPGGGIEEVLSVGCGA
jgi:hypothetical protein